MCAIPYGCVLRTSLYPLHLLSCPIYKKIFTEQKIYKC